MATSTYKLTPQDAADILDLFLNDHATEAGVSYVLQNLRATDTRPAALIIAIPAFAATKAGRIILRQGADDA